MDDDLESFPLLDMPVLVIAKILRKMSFIDLYIISILHPLLRRLIKTDVKRPNYAICIQTNGRVSIEFVNLDNNSFLESIRSEPKSRIEPPPDWDIGRSNRSLSPEYEMFVTPWKDPFRGARELFQTIHHLFSLPVYKAKIDLKSIEENYKPTIRWLSRICSIPKMKIYGKNVDFQAYTWVLEHAKPSRKLSLLAEPYEYFKKGTLNVDVPEVRISYGRWISVDNLLAIKSKVITISRSTFSAEDMNGFLHRFKEGSNPNLNKLLILFNRGQYPDYETCLEGLTLTPIDEEYLKWSFNLDNGDQGVITVLGDHGVAEEDAEGFQILVDREEDANQ